MEEEERQRIQRHRTGGSCPVHGNANECFDLNQRANCSEVDRCCHLAALPYVFSIVDLDLDDLAGFATRNKASQSSTYASVVKGRLYRRA